MDLDMDTTCPECDAPIPATIGDFARSRVVTCPRGHRVTLKDDDGSARKTDRAMMDLDKAIGKLGRDIKF